MQTLTHLSLAYTAECAVWDSPSQEATFVAAWRRGNVRALVRRHAG